MGNIDLHTHSLASPDGSLAEVDYRKMLAGGLDCIAVTDHNTTSFARQLQQTLGDHIIVGKEVTTSEGEIIGLYLTDDIPAGLTPLDTAKAIKAQGGLVYIPHPFETVRKGLSLETLNSIAPYVDIIEVYNGRAKFQNKSNMALAWAAQHQVPGAASSDAHGWHGWGGTHTFVEAPPTRANLLKLLATATRVTAKPGWRAVLYPRFNRIRKKAG